MYPQTPIEPQNLNNLGDSASALIADLRNQISAQAYRIAELEARLPRTNLVSPNFLTRAFAVWGHYFVSSFILGVIFSCIGLVFGVLMTMVLGLSVSDVLSNW